MKLKISNKKFDIEILEKRIDKFKSFKFKLDTLDPGICFCKKKLISTYFFCQNVDIIFTDKNNCILKVCQNLRSEKFVFGGFKSYYIYILKANSLEEIDTSSKLNVSYSKDEESFINKLRKKN